MRASKIFEGQKEKVSRHVMDDLISRVENTPPDEITYEVVKVGSMYMVIENSSNIIIFDTPSETEADSTCDHFNHDKDVGKDALIYSLNKNREIYSF